MALFTVTTPFNIDLEFSIAAFYKRMLAWLIDLLVIFIYSYSLLFLVYGKIFGIKADGFLTEDKMSTFLMYFTVIIPVMLYHLIFEVLMSGRSPGKLLMKIKVMNKEGASASISQLLLRWILCLPNYFLLVIMYVVQPAMILPIFMILGVVSLPDIITISITGNSQRLGDLAAGTVVVDTKYKMDIQETIFVDIEGQKHDVVYPEVLKLTDRDINGIRNLLTGKSSKEADDYKYRVAYRIEEVLNVKMNGDPKFFLRTLLKDYNYLTQNK